MGELVEEFGERLPAGGGVLALAVLAWALFVSGLAVGCAIGCLLGLAWRGRGRPAAAAQRLQGYLAVRA